MRRERLNKICRDYGILAAYLFGSLAKEGADLLDDKRPERIDLLTDIDLGVVFFERPVDPRERIKTYSRLYSDLSDVFSPLNLDLIFLQETGVIIQFEAINGVLLYSHDDDKRLDYEERVIKFYQDWRPDYDQYTKEVLEAICS